MSIAIRTQAEPKANIKRHRRTFGVVGLPLMLMTTLVGAHFTGLTLLNYESACKQALQNEIVQLREQQEALRTRLNLAGDDPSIRQWAEQNRMVRVEDQPHIVVWDIPLEPDTTQPTIIRQSKR